MLSNFSYEGKVARLLTTNELSNACGITVGTGQEGELDKCNYLMEHTKYSTGSNTAFAWWLENPRSTSSDFAWRVNGVDRSVSRHGGVSDADVYGVRPVIEVSKKNIDY